MFGPLGFPELIFILALALLIFGPKKLPEIGRTIGRAMGEFRRATTDLKRSFDTEVALDEDLSRPTAVDTQQPLPAAVPAKTSRQEPLATKPTEAEPVEPVVEAESTQTEPLDTKPAESGSSAG